jgi:hypothetical protein
MDHHKLSYVGTDRRNYIANQIFEKKERTLTHKKFTIPEFANQQIAIENERANRLEKLANLISIYPIDSISIKTIKSIIDLSFYIWSGTIFYVFVSDSFNPPIGNIIL